MFVIVRAIAPVAGIPPKKGTTIFAIPCAISSVLELCLSEITPSATIADNNDSIAPSIAIVKAAGINDRITLHVDSPSARFNSGNIGAGTPVGNSYMSPIVFISSIPANFFNNHTTSVIITIATNEPGIFFDIFGVRIMISKLVNPIAKAIQFIEERLLK